MRRTTAIVLSVVLGAALTSLAAESATYHVKFRFDGASGSYLADPPACPGTSRTGFDEYEGDLRGDESGFARDQQVVYHGVLRRRTQIDACDLLPEDANGVANYCNVHIEGGGEHAVELSVYADRTEVYFKASPLEGKVRYRAGGSCEREVVADYERLFREEGEHVEHWIGPRNYTRSDRVGGPPRAGTYRDQPPYPPHLPGHWTLTIGSPEVLQAEAGGPYRVERGQTVRLDGSHSRGQIRSYTWTLVGEPCAAYPPHLAAEAPSPLTKEGAIVATKALCRIVAKLVVSDGSGFDEDYTEVEVVPRLWRTRTAAPVKGTLAGNRLLWPCLHCQWGVNICAEEYAAGQMTSGHQIHSDTPGKWEGPKGYQLEPLRDPGGLWDGWWYVAKNGLTMARAELVLAADQRIALADGELFAETRNDAEVAAALARNPRFARPGVMLLPKSGGVCAALEYDSYEIPSFAEMGVEGPP